MKRKLVAVLFIGTFAASVIMSGCGKEKKEEKVAVASSTVTPDPTQTPSPIPTATPVPVKTIGEKVQGAYEILLKNETGKQVRGIFIKTEEETEYNVNLLMQNDPFKVDEERILFYKAAGKENADSQVEKQTYSIQLVFEDETKAVLHDFPFGDITKAEIHMEDNVAYLTYVSAKTKAPVSTKAMEMMAAMEEEVPAPEVIVTEAPSQNTNMGNDVPSYDNGDYDGGDYDEGDDGNTGGEIPDNGNTEDDPGMINGGENGNSGNDENTGDGPAINGGDSSGSEGDGNTDDGPAVNGGEDQNGGNGSEEGEHPDIVEQ